MWTNADEVMEFIEAHKGGRWSVGDRFVLPDIEQAYEVVAVRPFKHRGKFKLYIDLEAMCAVEDCDEFFMHSKEVHEWMSSRYVVRCCPEHRKGFQTPMQNAWKTQAELEEKAAAEKAHAIPRAEMEPRWGVAEKAVLEAVEALSLVYEWSTVRDVVRHAMGLLDAPAGRDTRKQTATRALRGLVEKEVLLSPGGVEVRMNTG